jgi:hypothetical protein
MTNVVVLWDVVSCSPVRTSIQEHTIWHRNAKVCNHNHGSELQTVCCIHPEQWTKSGYSNKYNCSLMLAPHISRTEVLF